MEYFTVTYCNIGCLCHRLVVIKDLILRAFMLAVFVISLCTHDIVPPCHVAISDFSDILVAMANRKTFLQLKL